ncbi:MAG: hypothetical protein WA182_11170 [Candidatus Sulfotelmatobacter sp.]
MQTLSLLPVARDIVEIFGIRADLLEKSPLGFDVREVLLALIFSAAFFEQAVLTPDALQGAMADGQIELADEAPGAESGKRFAQLDQLSFGGRRSFLRLVMTNAGKSEQARRAVLLKAPQPLADGGHSGGKETRGGLDAALLGALDEAQTMVVGVFQFTHQIEITGGGSNLSITHKSSDKGEAQLDIGQAGQASSSDRVSGGCVAGTREIAPESRDLDQVSSN